MQYYEFDSELFNYHGRWENVEGGKKSHWLRPYFEFYTDDSFILVMADGSGSFTVTVNGKNQESENGEYSVKGNSLIRITADDTGSPIVFKGIKANGKITFAPSRKKHILFIGDSLTHSPFSHSAVLPRELDCDYTAIAQGGMSLMVGRGYLNRPDRAGAEGMEAAFFKLQSPVEQGELYDYDFGTARPADMIILNLGTNDHLTDNDYAKDFIPAYTEFVGKVRKLYKEAPIYLLLPMADSEGGYRRDTIEKAAKECVSLYSNITYISSREWAVELSSDNIHPTEAGYAAYAKELLTYLKTNKLI